MVVNHPGNTFTIGFLDDEALDPMNLAMTGDVSKLEDDGTGDLAAVAVQSWAPSRGETVNVLATSGTFKVSLRLRPRDLRTLLDERDGARGPVRRSEHAEASELRFRLLD